MMLIRSEQMTAMEQYAERAFESEMVAHIREFAPARAKSMGEERLRTVARTGLSKARGHGFTCRGPLRLYLDLMCLFGSDFDTDPQCRWASEILSDTQAGIEMQRAARLYERAMTFMNEIAGSDRELLALGLQRISATPLRQFQSGDLERSILDALFRAYPQKARQTGEDGLHVLFVKAVGGAEGLHLNAPIGTALLTLTMSAAGSGVVGDPIYSSRIEQAIADLSAIDLRVTGLHACVTEIIQSIVEDITGTGLKREAQ